LSAGERSILGETLALVQRSGLVALGSFAILGGSSLGFTAGCIALAATWSFPGTGPSVFSLFAFIGALVALVLAHAGPLATYAIAIETDARPPLRASLRRGLRCSLRLAPPILSAFPACILFGIATACIASLANPGWTFPAILLRVAGAVLCSLLASWFLGVISLHQAASVVLNYPVVLPRGVRETLVLSLPGAVPVVTGAALVGRALSHDTTLSQLLSPGALDVALACGFILGATFSVLVSTAIAVVIANRRPEDRV